MERARNPIGIFDSGVGGLTVLQEIRRQLPHEPVLYFGDTARLPYGTRSPAEIVQFAREILLWMQNYGVKMAIAACNTSSALALEALRSEFSFPILGVILPGARAAARKGQRIGAIATPATVASQAYRRAIEEVCPDIRVWEVACPEFVPLIESNRIRDPYTYLVARQYLRPLLAAEIDTLVLGCTHYPHLTPVLREILPPHVHLVDPARYVVRSAAQELELMGLRSGDRGLRGSTRFFVSGEPEQFAHTAGHWLGERPFVEKVTLSPVELLS